MNVLGVGGGRAEGSRQGEKRWCGIRRGAEGGWVTNPSPSTRLPDCLPRVHTLSLPGNQGWVGGAPT